METSEQAPAGPRPRVTNACEACRSAKVKCMASNQLGICKRCLDSKRECIFKTGPRTRRPRQSKRSDSSANPAAPTKPLPPPPGPSKTFTIDIPMPADDDVTDSFEVLRLAHESSVNNLVPHISSGDDDDDDDEPIYDYDYDGTGTQESNMDWLNNSEHHASASNCGSVASHASSLPVGASALSTPPSSTAPTSNSGGGTAGKFKQKSRMVASLGLQPQFNVDSAGKLLATFMGVMLNHFHCLVIDPEKDTVASLAKERPFVLLAVLAAASGSRTLQGHSLYDEEFRKILGLKFVAGGERSLELLQGLVVYVAWYPFHLRPKNKQAYQYIRMAVDIVFDLELNEDPGTDHIDIPPTPERLEEIRTYIACYYLASSFASTWGRTPSLIYNAYTAHCCDMLSRHSSLKGDQILVWQVRLQRLVEETNDLRRTQRGGGARSQQSEYQINLMIRGMETQLKEWEACMSEELKNTPSIRLPLLFTPLFLAGAPLLKLPSTKYPSINPAETSFRADPARLQSIIPTLQTFYEYFLSLPHQEINAFMGQEWGSFILVVILGFRMSFPLAVCPGWDDRLARERLGMGGYLRRMCEVTVEVGEGEGGSNKKGKGQKEQDGGNKSMDVLSASRIVLGVVRKKFERRVARVEREREEREREEREEREQQRGFIGKVVGGVTAAAGFGMGTGQQQPMGGQQQHQQQHDPSIGGCPMMDGSMDGYYAYWDETFTNATTGVGAGAGGGFQVPAGHTTVGAGGGTTEQIQQQQQQMLPQVSNDLWATMTMAWAQGDMTFDGMGQ
ncbi:hypothetical protein B0T21DRAFT_450605 [Apiosordaria backusii]|uniref:Zn(2)-C6 fungal-type domain-containing protein n=1 Tax=Apiosordaria backusii TaxID=314023 RepID=A0AA40EDI8_9PEZI|nr:hypothetical protein B0T21DRAFT_450605 [Apiosordaria backusii]